MTQTPETKTEPATELGRQYHWMIAGEVVVTTPQGTRITGHYNTLLLTEGPCVSRRSLAKIQQILQVRMMKDRFPQGMPKDHRITDVVFLSMTNIGLMSSDEFNAGYADLADEQAQAEAAARESAGLN